ncbi:TPA: alpha-1,2-fucosyltransferase [Photobacterium damselae]
MKIVRIYGGLGNALFQLAFAKKLKRTCDSIVKIDMIGLNESYKEKIRFIINKSKMNLTECSYKERLLYAKIISKGIPKQKEIKLISKIFNIYTENEFGHIPNSNYSYYSGYFQNYVLVNEIKIDVSEALEKIAYENDFQIEDIDSCFLHVRRGDYCTPHALKVHGLITEDYYKLALDTYIKNYNVNVFTNDKNWVKDKLLKSYNLEIFENKVDYVYPDIQDLYFMSKHKRAIIANSTFSYWAACLCRDKEITIYPNKWFNEPKLLNKADVLFNKSWKGL